jgi:tubulin-specific chaperone A
MINKSFMCRLGKELESYENEENKQKEKVEKMKKDSADEYDIKKQIEVLQDTQQMIPDTLKRLLTALTDLEEHMVTIHSRDITLQIFL